MGRCKPAPKLLDVHAIIFVAAGLAHADGLAVFLQWQLCSLQCCNDLELLGLYCRKIQYV